MNTMSLEAMRTVTGGLTYFGPICELPILIFPGDAPTTDPVTPDLIPPCYVG